MGNDPEYTKKWRAEHPNYQKQYRAAHLGEHTAYMKKWYIKNSEKQQLRAKQQYEGLKEKAFEKYSDGSMSCAHCGSVDIEVLTVDHINNDGCHERKITGSGSRFYMWLDKNNYPCGYQILCRNCNWKKHLEYQRNGTRSS